MLCRAVLQMYLTDVEEGGETVFPHVPRLAQQTAGSGWTPCGMQVGGGTGSGAGFSVLRAASDSGLELAALPR